MSLATYTLIHVAISLVAILAGFVVLVGLINNKPFGRWTLLFLVTTVLTSVTGFGFPFVRFLPSHAFAIISLPLLGLAIYALYARRLAGRWRLTYVVTALVALYLNVFVLVVQAFQKVPPLRALAPNQNEPPFAIAQLVVLAAFIILGALAAIKFRPTPTPAP